MNSKNILHDALESLQPGEMGIRCFDPVQNHIAVIIRGSEGQYLIRTEVSGILIEFSITFVDALANCQTYIEHIMATRSIEEGPF